MDQPSRTGLNILTKVGPPGNRPKCYTDRCPHADPAVVAAVRQEGACCVGVEWAIEWDHFAHCMHLAMEWAESGYVRQQREAYALDLRFESKPWLIQNPDARQWGRDPDNSPLWHLGCNPILFQTMALASGSTSPMALRWVSMEHILPSAPVPRRWSQNWHRSPEDDYVMRVVVYCSDVYDDCGPVEYVARSHHNFTLCGGRSYMDPKRYGELRPEDIRRLTGPAGTLVVMDGNGIYREGYGTKPRTSITFTYTTYEMLGTHFYEVGI